MKRDIKGHLLFYKNIITKLVITFIIISSLIIYGSYTIRQNFIFDALKESERDISIQYSINNSLYIDKFDVLYHQTNHNIKNLQIIEELSKVDVPNAHSIKKDLKNRLQIEYDMCQTNELLHLEILDTNNQNIITVFTLKSDTNFKNSIKDFKQKQTFYLQKKGNHTGYRFIRPLEYNKQRIGYIDILFDSKYLINNFNKFNNFCTHLLYTTRDDFSVDMVGNKDKYNNSQHNNCKCSQAESKYLLSIHSTKIKNNIAKSEKFSIYLYKNSKVIVASFLPIFNDNQKKHVAYIVGFSQNTPIYHIILIHRMSTVSLIFLLAIGLIILKKNIYLKDKYKTKNMLFSNVIDSIDSVIFYKDINFQYIGCNSGFEEFSGMKREDIIGKNDFELFGKKEAFMYRDMDMSMFNTETTKQNFEWLYYPNGKEIYSLTTKSPIRDNKGNIIGLVGICADVTKQKKLETKLKEINSNQENLIKKSVEENLQKDALLQQQHKLALMGELLGAISHQWRQPLNILNINIENLKYDMEDGLISVNFINTFIHKQTKIINSMSATIDSFMNFYRTDKAKNSYKIEGIINDVVEIESTQFYNNNIEINVDIKDNFEVYCNGNELKQVLFNLLSNAKDAFISKKITNREVTIDAYIFNNSKFIDVSDNGGGVDESIISRIFEPYFTTKDEGKGTGIGLYMSKLIIEKSMNGEILGYNTDNGIKFMIELNSDDKK